MTTDAWPPKGALFAWDEATESWYPVTDYALDTTLQQILIALAGAPTQAIENVFLQNAAVPSGVMTAIGAYVVPVGKTFRLKRYAAWADVDAEYLVDINGVEVSGGRTSIAKPTLIREYGDTPLIATAGQVITVRGLRQSPSVALPFTAELNGVLS